MVINVFEEEDGGGVAVAEEQEREEDLPSPQAEGAENKEEEMAFETAKKQVIAEGLELMAQNNDPGGENPKEYHTTENHLKPLEERKKRIVKALRMSSEQAGVAEMAIVWHDGVVNETTIDPENIIAMVGRLGGAEEGDPPAGAEGNEAQSGRGLEASMRRQGVFSEEQIANAVLSVKATYARAEFGKKFSAEERHAQIIAKNPELAALVATLAKEGIDSGPYFFQPHLKRMFAEAKANGTKVAPEILTMALSDLGGAGMESKEVMAREGDNEARELFKNVKKPETLQRLLRDDSEESASDRAKVAKALLGFVAMQPGFIAWRWIDYLDNKEMAKDTGSIDPAHETDLDAESDHFKTNALGAVERQKMLRSDYESAKASLGERHAFESLARSVGYEYTPVVKEEKQAAYSRLT